jgi:hypothetical protein
VAVGKRREVRRVEQQRIVRAALSTALPELTEEDIITVLAEARAVKGIPLRQLADHLAVYPNALTSGDPRCPLVVIRLAHALHGTGRTAVVRPACANCSKVTVNLDRLGPDGRLCQMCWVRSNLATCYRCHRSDIRIAARRAEGGICYACYRVDAEVVERCGRCQRAQMPVSRLDGIPFCRGCWNPRIHAR